MSPSREYELVLMLDPDIPDERREQIVSEARNRIESGGSLKHDTTWGMRKLAYEIEQRTEADYRLLRFETDGGLLDDLNHNLRIADGVLRFRIFKVDPRSPAIVPPAPVGAGGAPARGGRRPEAPAESEPAAAESAKATSGNEANGAPEAAAEETPATSAPEEAEPAAADAADEEPPQAADQDPEGEAS